jgi:transcriptional antiterminator Rof (Rho-off)
VEITGEDPSEFTLVEVPDRQAILEADPQADNETVQRDDGEYVVVTENGESRLIPVGEYFPSPEERSYATGDTLEYSSQTATVDNVTADQAVLVWEATETESIEVQDEGIVTLVETDLVAHFADSSTLHLSSDIEGYEAQVSEIEQFEQYNSGLTRVVVLALFSIVLLLSAAFIPSRY